jgi:beta-galactosidase
VELFLNGRSLGRKKTNRDTAYLATWHLPYQTGVLKAVGYSEGKEVSSAELRSAGPVARFNLLPDRTTLSADGQDLSYVTVELVDTNGVRNPNAENLMKFAVTGPGDIIAVANANPMSTESYQRPQRKAWQGRCLVIIKARKEPGQIMLTVSSAGLNSAKVVITASSSVSH